MILGIDASTYLEELEHGAKYYDGECRIDPLNAFLNTSGCASCSREYMHRLEPSSRIAMINTELTSC